MKRKFLRHVLPPALALLTLLVTLEYLCQRGLVPSYLIPAPTKIFETLQIESHMLSEALYSTVLSSLLGLLLTLVLGFLLGSLSYFIPLFSSILTPYTVFFQTVPIVAIAPLLVIWLGFGTKSVVASSFIVSLFPMISGTLMGFRSVDRSYLDLFKLYQSGFWHKFSKLLVPSSLPYFFQSLKVCAGLSIIGAIVGEFMSGTGLGSVIEVSRVQFRIDLMFAAIILTSLYGLALLLVCNFLSYYFLRNWHASETSTP